MCHGPISLSPFVHGSSCAQLGLITWSRGGISAYKGAVVECPPPRPSCSYMLWIHGASVGETMASLPIVRCLLEKNPHSAVLVTASKGTALERLSLEKLGPRVLLQHRPLDCSSMTSRFLQHWRPSALILIESELWPCLLLQTHRAGVPIAIANARLSDRTVARWIAAQPLRASLQFLLSLCDVTLAQTPAMEQRLRELGSVNSQFVGDLKQLPSTTPPSVASVRALQAFLSDASESAHPCSATAPSSLRSQTRDKQCTEFKQRKVWLAASTHPGEEAVVLEAHASLRRDHPDLLLLLAPRHPERRVLPHGRGQSVTRLGSVQRNAASAYHQAHAALSGEKS